MTDLGATDEETAALRALGLDVTAERVETLRALRGHPDPLDVAEARAWGAFIDRNGRSPDPQDGRRALHAALAVYVGHLIDAGLLHEGDGHVHAADVPDPGGVSAEEAAAAAQFLAEASGTARLSEAGIGWHPLVEDRSHLPYAVANAVRQAQGDPGRIDAARAAEHALARWHAQGRQG